MGIWKHITLAAVIGMVISVPLGARANEIWDCQPNSWWLSPPYLFRVDGKVLLVPPPDRGMGVDKKLPIVRNDDNALIAISTYPERTHEFEIVIIDKQLQRVRLSVVNTRGTLDEDFEQYRGPCKKVQ